jgi:hypothetical protein
MEFPGLSIALMKWLTLLNLMAAEAQRFENAPLPVLRPCKNHDELLTEHQRAEIESRAQVDASVRMFSRERHWPAKLSKNEQYFLQQRIVIAFIFSGYLACPKKNETNPILPEAPDSFGDEEQIEWLLIDGWHSVGWRMWLSHQRIRLGLLRGEKP